MVLITVAALIFGTNTASAYNLEGYKWGGTPSSGCCASIYFGFRGSYLSDVETAFTNGYEAWNESAANVVFVDNGSANISFEGADNSGVTWDGLTTYNTLSNGTFSYAWAYVNYYYTRGYSASVTQGVAAHELGHVLGLAHTNGCVLMTPDTPTRAACGIDTPTSDDINGVNHLY